MKNLIYNKMSPNQEAEYIYHTLSCESLEKAISMLVEQFKILHSKGQLLLTLVTVTLTITGFSGPRIAASNLFSRITLVCGLSFTLCSAIFILTGTLGIRWVTNYYSEDPIHTLTVLINRRNRNSSLFSVSTWILVIGLVLYTISIISFMIIQGTINS
ncbi:MAG: hypothetical protein MJB14_18890 [Spirochaetes bacterium]|nr:hypothetical protein [Spirochaetota bacterium]